MTRKKIAIVGSGVSGLATLWTLRNTDHEIHLYEKDDRLGGHTNTVIWTHNGKTTPVDTGFIVLNSATYRKFQRTALFRLQTHIRTANFIAFLQALNIRINPTEMTFGVSRDKGSLEWSGTSLNSIFAQRRNIISPRFWRMILDIVRFNQFALDLLSEEAQTSNAHSESELSIGEYLEQNGYSDAFRDDYLIPMTACVWSAGPEKCALEFPAMTLVRFMWNHHLLNTISERPPWLTVEGGAQRYIDAVLKTCPKAKVHLGTPVLSLVSKRDRVTLTFGGVREDEQEDFDEVVLACHGNQALRIVGGSATMEQKEILSAFKTTPNMAYLHSDLSVCSPAPYRSSTANRTNS